jgi:hypothetical protein
MLANKNAFLNVALRLQNLVSYDLSWLYFKMYPLTRCFLPIASTTVSPMTVSTSSPTTQPVNPQTITITSAVTISIMPAKATTTTTPTPAPTPAPGTTVYIGQNSQEQLAFFYQDSCQNYVFLAYLGTGVCEKPFTMSDGVTYTVHGCGGTPWITWGSGTFLGNCVFESLTMPDCPKEDITGAWICG